MQACGVSYTLSEEEVEEGEVDALRQQLDKQAQEVGGWWVGRVDNAGRGGC